MNYSFCCVIPVYNNAATVHDVIRRTKLQTKHLLVIDDGSTDINLEEYYAGSDVEVIRHKKNLGKGAALRTALRVLGKRGTDYMITLDADGQHFPEDIPRFFPFLRNNNFTLAVGCRDLLNEGNVPLSSRIGRKLANFWMRVETGISIHDCQSGFRAYPVKYVNRMKLHSRGYEFETEILVRAAWGELELKNLRVRCSYPPPEKRISHFRPLRDNLRISLMHMRLIGLRLIPFPKKALVQREKFKFSFLKPKELFAYLLKENATPGELAAAAFMGAFCAVLPLFGFHTPLILYLAAVFHLNKFMAFLIQHPFMPPLTPFLCIELGYFMRYGCFLTDFNWQTLGREIGLRAWEWLLGSLILAPLFASIAAAAVYLTALCFQKKIRLKFRQEYRREKQNVSSRKKGTEK